MKRLERILAALTPKRWPVRWRLAAVSATLTLIILVIFAVVVGRLTSNRLQSDFNDELRDDRDADSQPRSASPRTLSAARPQCPSSPARARWPLAGNAGIRVVTPKRRIVSTSRLATPRLGPTPSRGDSR